MDSTSNPPLYKSSQFLLTKYANKKGVDKYQMTLDRTVLEALLSADQPTITYIQSILNGM